MDLSNFEVLFETIITALKPVVYTEVDRALASSKYANKIDSNALAQKIILEITPYVREALQKEVQKIQDNTLTEDQVVQLVITDLKPTVIRVIQGKNISNDHPMILFQNISKKKTREIKQIKNLFREIAFLAVFPVQKFVFWSFLKLQKMEFGLNKIS